MKLILDKKPKNPIIIEGFPGLGFIGSIATDYLIEHLKAEKIGKFESKDSVPMVAIHNSKVVEPFGIFYSKKHNIILVHALNPVTNVEWKLADAINELVKQTGAKEVISLESVASMTDTTNAYYFSNNIKNNKKLASLKVEPLKEGIILGVTGALLLSKNLPVNCVFVETHSKLPDSKGAAKVLEILDNYLNLNVDTKPLLEKAKKFEDKLKNLMQQTKKSTEVKDKSELNYLG
ncbi:PAC2 family protein [archaeon]|nr:PAC2 family protein [archaeon]